MDTTVNAQKPRRMRIVFRIGVLLLVTIGLLAMFGSKRPTNLGVSDGKLALCPDKPNCVSTQAERPEQKIAPLVMNGSLEKVTEVARKLILEMPRTRFVVQEPDYCHVECTSLICRYVDDLEIWIDQENQLIHARSASRVGYSDLGVNRKRVESLFRKLVEAGVAKEQPITGS